MSLSLTGRFQSDGHGCLRGYELWASDVNSACGLLGRPVRLVVLNDKSNPNVAETDYIALITKNHVDLTLGPFSSLLTYAAGQATSSGRNTTG